MFIGLNPSTADETTDDPTIRRCVGYAKNWGYAALVMTNLWAYRATDPREMREALAGFEMDSRNDSVLVELASTADLVVAAWGTHGEFQGRGDQVRRMIPGLHVLRLTKQGYPAHPLYLPATLSPEPWVPEEAS